MSNPEMARLPSARFNSSSGKPASSSAPSTMSPEMPEKQSKYRMRDISVRPSAARALQLTQFLEAAVARVAEHDVIHQVDSHQRSGRRQPPGQLHIVGAGAGIPRRLIMEDH